MRMTSRIRQRNLELEVDMITRQLEKGDLGSGRPEIISSVIGNIIDAKEQAIESKGIIRDELHVNLLAMLMAGSQLTTTALAALTYYLLHFAKAMKKLRQEMLGCFAAEKVITIISTLGMPYLDAVVSETVSTHHPARSDSKS